MSRFSAYWFTVVFSIAYPLLIAAEWHWVVYYPLVDEWSLRPLPGEQGPPMHWYGLMVTAAVPAVVFAVILKDKWLPALVARWIGVFPLASMGVLIYQHRGFFWV